MKLTDQAAARVRDTSERVRSNAEYQKGVAKGLIHDVAEPLRADRAYDDKTLLQKVRSEALGYSPDTESIEVGVTDGMVRIRGSIDNKAHRERLIEMIRAIDGVDLIDDQLKSRCLTGVELGNPARCHSRPGALPDQSF